VSWNTSINGYSTFLPLLCGRYCHGLLLSFFVAISVVAIIVYIPHCIGSNWWCSQADEIQETSYKVQWWNCSTQLWWDV